MKAILKYPGSKWNKAEWITSFFPPHHSYLEPFFGSGAVLFNKERSNMETVNDLDNNVVNLFQWIKKDPEKLAHEIYYTPYARQVYEDAFSMEPKNSLEKALFFISVSTWGMDTEHPGNVSAGRTTYRAEKKPMLQRTGARYRKRFCRQQKGSGEYRSKTGQPWN